jgi:hypothetical protein
MRTFPGFTFGTLPLLLLLLLPWLLLQLLLLSELPKHCVPASLGQLHGQKIFLSLT